ncbi:MAG: HDOD domain-containing protein [Ectothiorhodospiraceae bacterium]|nr:HDOD domain-containing protein [Ectothiorhodospiraceae bacterium]
METDSRRRVEDWLGALGNTALPIMATTRQAAAATRDSIDDARTLGELAYRDPALCVNLLREANRHHHRHLDARTTTVEQAVMMLGLTRTLTLIDAYADVESALDQPGLDGFLAENAAAYHAACHAHAWAEIRKDILPTEIRTAATLAPVATLLLWQHEADAMHAACELSGHEGHLRPDAEYVQLGFYSGELGAMLVQHWRLPAMVTEQLLPNKIVGNRALGINLAFRLTALAPHGWDHPGIDALMSTLGVYLGGDEQNARTIVQKTTARALDNWPDPLPPAWAPLAREPGTRPRSRPQPATGETAFCLLPQRQLLDRLLESCRQGGDSRIRQELGQQHRRVDPFDPPIALALRALHHACGLNRSLFLIADSHGELLHPYMAVGWEGEPLLLQVDLPVHPGSALAHQLADGEPHWLTANQVDVLQRKSRTIAYQLLDRQGAYLAPIRVDGRLFGLLYADRRGQGCGLDARSYDRFRRTSTALKEGITRTLARQPLNPSSASWH